MGHGTNQLAEVGIGFEGRLADVPLRGGSHGVYLMPRARFLTKKSATMRKNLSIPGWSVSQPCRCSCWEILSHRALRTPYTTCLLSRQILDKAHQ